MSTEGREQGQTPIGDAITPAHQPKIGGTMPPLTAAALSIATACALATWRVVARHRNDVRLAYAAGVRSA